MKGGVILFRGVGAAARRNLELASDSRVVFALLGFSWKSDVHDLLLNERALWLQKLGELVYSRTLEDVVN